MPLIEIDDVQSHSFAQGGASDPVYLDIYEQDFPIPVFEKPPVPAGWNATTEVGEITPWFESAERMAKYLKGTYGLGGPIGPQWRRAGMARRVISPTT